MSYNSNYQRYNGLKMWLSSLMKQSAKKKQQVPELPAEVTRQQILYEKQRLANPDSDNSNPSTISLTAKAML